MHLEQHTELDNLITMQHLRTSAKKGSNDAYDVHTSLTINEENIDFNIPGLPHSAVKRSHGVNVHNLIQRIENHPHRHARQSDLQQH